MNTIHLSNKNKDIKFATVREDPTIIIPIIKQYNIKKLLTICSGGCSALSYKAIYPQLDISVFDKNIYQLKLLNKKLNLLTSSSNNSVKLKKIIQLNNCGLFEDIFKCFRNFINTFLISKEEIKKKLMINGNIKQYADAIFSDKYWKLAFNTFFSDNFLQATFGPQAIQNAEANSYAIYFQRCFEIGILRADRQENYFLHFALLGEYLDNNLPIYMTQKLINTKIQMFPGNIWDVNNIPEYDLIDLSNIFDWMSLKEANSILNFLAENTKKNCLIIFRNLNNTYNYATSVEKFFNINYSLSKQMFNKSRDLFYSSMTFLEKK